MNREMRRALSNSNSNINTSSLPTGAINNIKQMLSMSNGVDSNGLMQMMMAKNPQVNQIMQMANSNGMSLEQMARQLYAERGLNYDEAINQVQS